ncbi:MAG: M36 family metallopeptidase [Flavobacteriaceae bacterium]
MKKTLTMNYTYKTLRKNILVGLVVLLGTSGMSFGQLVSNTPAKKRGQISAVSKSTVPLSERINTQSTDYVITGQHTSSVSGIKHIYLRQAINGIEVAGTDSSIHLDAQGKVVASHNNFIENIGATVKNSVKSLSASQAITKVAAKMGYKISQLEQLERNSKQGESYLFSKAGISGTEIPVKLQYVYQEGKGTTLVWELSVQEMTSSNWWVFNVHASNGTIVTQENLTISCFDDTHAHGNETNVVNAKEPALFYTVENEPSLMVGTYGVVPLPYESPGHSPNQNVLISVANPDNANASPFGWHDTNGAAGAEFTRTQGNNCSAYDDDNNTNSASTAADYAEGGASLNFTGFSYSPTYSNGNQSEDAAVTNLFYWTNIIHDVVYQYGFDEASGNFQENNYGNGGLGSDSVNSEAQDGSGTCNANFGTPTDGGNPRMQMYVCGSRDGDFDNGVIVHEYGHGISTRLTGGPSNSSCLNNTEQMGEGWSDYYALMLTMESGDAGTDSRGIGTWLIGEGPTGDGIRTYPYSTNFAINPHTYDDINSEVAPHGVGSVWCAMLWEMTWELIADHGYSTDLYTFTGNAAVDAGNVQALAIVTEGLKLQPCSPGFVDGRDAILLADQNIYGGANQCAIWDAFARRGLGYSANQGSSGSKIDGTEAFDLPPGTAQFNNSVTDVCITSGVQTGLSGGSPSGGVYSGVGVTDDGNGLTYTFDPSVPGVGTTTVTYTVIDACTGGNANLNETIEVKDGTPVIVCQDTTVTLGAGGSITIDPFGNQATLVGGNNGSNSAGFSALVTTPTQDVTISFDWAYSTTDDPDFDSFGYILGSTYFALSNGASANQSGSFSISLTAGTQFGFCTYTADNTFGAATGVVTNFAPGFIGQFAAANFTEVQQNSDGTATIDQVNILGIVDSCSTTTFSGQTTFTCLDIGVNAVSLTVTDDSSTLSSVCVSNITVLPNAAQLTTFSGGSWNNGAPTNTSVATFNSNYDTATFGNVEACSCTINTGSTVTVSPDDYMRVQGNTTVDGTLIVEHQASFVQVSPDAVVTNNGIINVNQTTPNLASRDFMLLGSPMSGESRNDVWNSAFLVLNHDTSLFVPNAAVAAAFPLAENFADDNYDNWIAYNGVINVGEGYIVRPQTGYGQPGGIFNYTYDTGTLNNGNVNFNVLYNTPGPTSADNKNASPNILANPYASAIWANDFINANSMVDELYFWEHNTPPSPSLPGAGSMNFSMEDISMYNLGGGVAAASGGTAPNGYIATGQGFAIKANAAGTATFTNSMRRIDNNNTLRTSDESIERIWLKVETPQYEMQSSTLVVFTENATPDIDKGYDSRRMATVVSLYSQLEDGTQELGIQSREQFNKGMKIPLGFSSLIEDKIAYQISIDQLDGANLNATDILLVDLQENNIVNLKNGAYTFMSEEGTYADRFVLIFQSPKLRLGIEDTILETVSVFPNPTQGQLTIISPTLNIESVTIYDIQGREMVTSTQVGKSVKINMESLQSSVYFVTVQTEFGTLTKRVVKR